MLNISDFTLFFYVKTATPLLKKVIPLFPSNPPLKTENWDPVKPHSFWKYGQRLNPPPERAGGGGAHHDALATYYNNFKMLQLGNHISLQKSLSIYYFANNKLRICKLCTKRVCATFFFAWRHTIQTIDQLMCLYFDHVHNFLSRMSVGKKIFLRYET